MITHFLENLYYTHITLVIKFYEVFPSCLIIMYIYIYIRKGEPLFHILVNLISLYLTFHIYERNVDVKIIKTIYIDFRFNSINGKIKFANEILINFSFFFYNF